MSVSQLVEEAQQANGWPWLVQAGAVQLPVASLLTCQRCQIFGFCLVFYLRGSLFHHTPRFYHVNYHVNLACYMLRKTAGLPLGVAEPRALPPSL